MPDLVQEDLDVVDLLAASAGVGAGVKVGGAGGKVGWAGGKVGGVRGKVGGVGELWEGWEEERGQRGKVGGAGRESVRGKKRRRESRKRAASVHSLVW